MLDNDFVIIKLAKEVKFTKHVNPICLPQPNSNQNFDSVEATASGWGSLEKQNSQQEFQQDLIHDILQKVHIYTGVLQILRTELLLLLSSGPISGQSLIISY